MRRSNSVFADLSCDNASAVVQASPRREEHHAPTQPAKTTTARTRRWPALVSRLRQSLHLRRRVTASSKPANPGSKESCSSEMRPSADACVSSEEHPSSEPSSSCDERPAYCEESVSPQTSNRMDPALGAVILGAARSNNNNNNNNNTTPMTAHEGLLQSGVESEIGHSQTVVGSRLTTVATSKTSPGSGSSASPAFETRSEDETIYGLSIDPTVTDALFGSVHSGCRHELAPVPHLSASNFGMRRVSPGELGLGIFSFIKAFDLVREPSTWETILLLFAHFHTFGVPNENMYQIMKLCLHINIRHGSSRRLLQRRNLSDSGEQQTWQVFIPMFLAYNFLEDRSIPVSVWTRLLEPLSIQNVTPETAVTPVVRSPPLPLCWRRPSLEVTGPLSKLRTVVALIVEKLTQLCLTYDPPQMNLNDRFYHACLEFLASLDFLLSTTVQDVNNSWRKNVALSSLTRFPNIRKWMPLIAQAHAEALALDAGYQEPTLTTVYLSDVDETSSHHCSTSSSTEQTLAIAGYSLAITRWPPNLREAIAFIERILGKKTYQQ